MDVRKQLHQRLESLKAAGVEFLPRPAVATALPIPETTMPKTTAPAASLFVAEVTQMVGDERRKSLEVLVKEVSVCKKCPELFSTRTQTVFGVGKVEPELCFVGEAPGADEDAKGEPFVGRAGQLLDKIIVASGFQRNDVYICNTLKCRPPNNATPTPVQCENCRPFFERQIDLVKPKWICCLGAVAAKNVLATESGIGKLRGKVHDYRGIPVVCTYHPAYLLRNPAAKGDCWNDMKFLLTQMGREIPKTKA
jgi:DNA polymerase